MAKTRQEPTAPPAFVGPYELAMLAAQAPKPPAWAETHPDVGIPNYPPQPKHLTQIPGYIWHALMLSRNMHELSGIDLCEDELREVRELVNEYDELMRKHDSEWAAGRMRLENRWRVEWARDLLAQCSENER